MKIGAITYLGVILIGHEGVVPGPPYISKHLLNMYPSDAG